MIKHIRIDDRLVHGQVATAWINTLSVNRVMVVHDASNSDETQKKLLRMATPTPVQLSVLTVEKAVDRISKGQYDQDSVLMIVKNTEDALRLYQSGYSFQEINIGNLPKRQNAKELVTGIFVDEKDQENLNCLMELGVNVTAQQIPSGKVTKIGKF